jgi:hypothetical protein
MVQKVSIRILSEVRLCIKTVVGPAYSLHLQQIDWKPPGTLAAGLKTSEGEEQSRNDLGRGKPCERLIVTMQYH